MLSASEGGETKQATLEKPIVGVLNRRKSVA